MSSEGGFRQYMDRYDLTSGPVRFKKPTMLSVTEQLFSLKMAGSQNCSAEKHPISGGNVVESTTSSPDAMVEVSRKAERKERAIFIYPSEG